MSGEFENGKASYEITGKYGDAISLSDIPVPTGTEGYEFAGWDNAVPTTFGNDDGIIKTEIKDIQAEKDDDNLPSCKS